MHRFAALTLGVLFVTPALQAQERLVRHFGPEQGLLAPTVVALTQDHAGFLWVATAGGVFRYDGVEMRHWAADVITHANALAAAPDGRVAAVDDYGRVFLLDAAGADPVQGPRGTPLDSVGAITFVGDTLWVARGTTLMAQPPDGRWLPPIPGLDVPPRRLRPAPTGGVDAATHAGVWTAPAHGPLRRLFPLVGAWDVLGYADGRRVAISGAGRVVEWSHGRLVERLNVHNGAGRALALRGDVIWASYSAFIAALHADGSSEILGPSEGVDGGGPLLVDREGSLWVGTYTALLQLPEPETTWWGERQGLPSSLTRYVGGTRGTVWVTTWSGLGRLTHDARGWHGSVPRVAGGYDRFWTDAARDRLVVGMEHGTVTLRGPGVAPSPAPAVVGALAYAPAPDGGLWVGSGVGLYHTDATGGAARRVAGTPFTAVATLATDSGGRLWSGAGEQVCHAPVRGVASGGPWACDTLAGSLDVTALVAFPSGDVWAATRGLAIVRWRQGRWTQLPGARVLPTRNVLNLIPARGAVWVAAFGAVLRVAERPDTPDGWEVLEHLTGWHGLPGRGANDVLEEPDGTLWLTTARGVMRVPAAARRTPHPPPPVTLVDARVDTAAVPLARALVLPHERNRLELRFAALSLRDPSPILYQVRLGPDDPWSDTRGLPSFRWVDLPGGHYRAEVRASADGLTWSSAPAAFQFVVRPPWYREPWALALFTLAAIVALVLVYRARVAVLLGLERQRARIAMDLHDEIGSALGSIGILSGVLAQDGAPGAQIGEQHRIAHEIARTAGEVGGALSDIVWSLDPRPGTLRDLAARLADHGERLFASDDVEFRTSFPQAWPPAALPLALRRNVVAVGLEALHNAARHARARHVSLALAPQDGGWELVVRDDGSGLRDAPDTERAGLGLTSMRRRAAEVGGRVAWEPTPGGGTTMRFAFPLPAAPRGPLARVWARLVRRGNVA
ncbi:MAG TPA: ATP-binding protein [Gemmatimonadales bacterium]|nr:ATP-binding protein [Gemmatimonadales bacterium]